MSLIIPKNIPSNFCIAPFVSTRPEVRHKNSPCAYGALDIPQPGLSAKNKWNSKELNQLRQDFIDNKQPDVCERCWQEERAGKQSLRQRTISYNPTAYEDLIVSGKWTDGPMSITFKSSNVCNLACRSCGSHDSNQFDNEGMQYLKEYNIRGQYIANDRPQHVNMIDYVPICDNVKHIEFFGGEPLLNVTQFELLQHLVDIGRSENITLYYNTNATNTPTERLQELWKCFKSIEISCSIDGIEDKFEYLRFPGKWDICLSTLDNLQEMQLGIPTRVVGNMTTSITNVVDTTEIYEWHKQRFGEYPYNSMVDSPSYMSIKNIPSKFKTQIESHLTMPEVIGYLNIDIKYPNAFREWIKWMKRMDRYREQQFSKVFPIAYDIIRADWDSISYSDLVEPKAEFDIFNLGI